MVANDKQLWEIYKLFGREMGSRFNSRDSFEQALDEAKMALQVWKDGS